MLASCGRNAASILSIVEYLLLYLLLYLLRFDGAAPLLLTQSLVPLAFTFAQLIGLVAIADRELVLRYHGMHQYLDGYYS